MNIKEIAERALNQAQSLVPNWLPSGKQQGHEWVCGDLSGVSGDSCKVNLSTGKWADFAANIKGGDLVSLYAAINNLSQKDAALQVESLVGGGGGQTTAKPAASSKLIPPPEGLKRSGFTHKQYGGPTAIWKYLSAEGGLLFYVARYDHDGKKTLLPYSYSEDGRWVNRGWPAPRPLFNLPAVTQSDKVLIVEGEKAATAAASFCGGEYAVITWPNGVNAWDKTDWTPIYGKHVLIWPDHDEPGRIAAAKIGAHLLPHCPDVKIISTLKDEYSDGWDAADSNFTADEFKVWADARAVIVELPKTEEALPPDRQELPPMPTDVDAPASINDGGPFYYAPTGREKPVPEYLRMAEYCFNLKKYCFDDTLSLEYNGKNWKHLSKSAFTNYVLNTNKPYITPNHLDQFVKMVKARCYAGEIFESQETDGLINLNNGVLNVLTGNLSPHSYKYPFRYCSPVDFDASAECNRWAEFLYTIFKGNIELMDLAQRMFGYILIGGDPFLHRAFVLYGEGRNGKSTFIDVLRWVLGSESYSAVSLSDLDKKFSVVNLDGVIANLVEETPTDAINDEIFKTAIGGGELIGSKKFADEYKFKCKARFVFACNDMPVFRDRSTGLEDRLVILPFTRYFTEAERDTKIGEKLRAELPGIINWAVEGARWVLKDRALPSYNVLIESKDFYKMQTDPLYAWFEENIQVGTDISAVIATKDIYMKYAKDVRELNSHPVSFQRFNKSFKKLVAKACQVNGIYFDPDAQVRDASGKRGYQMLGIIGQSNSSVSSQSGWQARLDM